MQRAFSRDIARQNPLLVNAHQRARLEPRPIAMFVAWGDETTTGGKRTWRLQKLISLDGSRDITEHNVW